MQLQIDNEYDRLEAVLVHRPGAEIERLTFENMREYLFEDTPYLKRMREEHDAFTARMRERGVEVVYIEDLLTDVFRDDGIRQKLVSDVCRSSPVSGLAEELSDTAHWSAEELTEVMFAGVTVAEFRDRAGYVPDNCGGEEDLLLPPVPNAYFSRDPAVVVRGAAICCKMHYEPRVRETQIIRTVLEKHSEFKGNRITYGGTSEPTEDRPFTIEGGDVIILSPKAVLIGASERTRRETIRKLAEKCFRFGDVERVYEVPIPSERSYMHLDTVFTVLDRGVVLWYAPVMAQANIANRYERTETGTARRMAEDRSFTDVLKAEFDCDVTIIETAGGSKHHGSREQRMDGTNSFAIAPHVVIMYERNERTAKALQAKGVECITIPGSELVRGLGGPRCMTMPLRRAASAS